MEDISADLRQLQQYATGLGELMGDLERAAPDHSEGTDRSGMVRVRLGRGGIPDAFAVASYWRDRLAPGSFGSAVAEACQDALLRRGREWAEVLQRNGWQDRLRRLDAEPSRPAAAGATGVPAAFRRAGAGQRPLPLDMLADQVTRRLGDLESPSAAVRAQPWQGRGANPRRTLALTVSEGGQVGCQADPGWVASQSGAELTEALNAALSGARQQLATAAEARAQEAGQADQLTAGILTAFDELVHQTEA